MGDSVSVGLVGVLVMGELVGFVVGREVGFLVVGFAVVVGTPVGARVAVCLQADF